MEAIELKSMTIARKALQSGLNDTLSSLKEYPKQLTEDIDSQLKKENLPELKSLLAVVQKTIDKTLKRQKIKNLDEYYIIKEVVEDTTYEISEEKKLILSKCMFVYELKEKKKRK